MECGKLRSSPGSPIIFYFVVDAASPLQPSSERVKSYFITTLIDSYVEAFHYLVRCLCNPPTDVTLRPWHETFTRVFGTVSYDAFLRSVQTISLKHFALDTSEAAARKRSLSSVSSGSDTVHKVSEAPVSAADASALLAGISTSRPQPVASLFGAGNGAAAANASTLQQHRDMHQALSAASPGKQRVHQTFDSTFSVYPRESANEDARVELHRLRAELAETSGRLNVEKSRASVNVLSHAEKQALVYQLEQARQEATSERNKANAAAEKLRLKVAEFDDRIRHLQEQHEETLREKLAIEHQRYHQLEEDFLRKDGERERETDAALRDRDRKLTKAVSRLKMMETHIEDALKRVEEQKMTITTLTQNLMQCSSERNALEEDVRRLQRQVHSLQLQVEDSQHQISRADEAMRTSQDEAFRLRAMVAKLKSDNERYHQFSASLQSELRVLDDSAGSAVDILRRKVMAQRNGADERMVGSLSAISAIGVRQPGVGW